MPHMEHDLKFIKPEELSSISDLQLLARTVVEGLMSGLHRSPHSGSSIEFAQYRRGEMTSVLLATELTPGDHSITLTPAVH